MASIAQTFARRASTFVIVSLALCHAALALQTTAISVGTKSGSHAFIVEWAVNEAERERGLMERKSMPEDHGMIFDFETEQTVTFWMKDTPLSLDMVFIKADGAVSRIARKATPFSETVIPGGPPVRYVLELIGGESDRIGLAVGDRFKIGSPP